MSFDLGDSQIAWHVDFDSQGDTEGEGEAPQQVARVLRDRFELRGELGAGGMGVVYRAFDRKVGREVALKLVKAERGSSGRERLLAEGGATARLSHPGIVRVHGAGEAGGQAYLVYELVEGGRDLGSALPEATLDQRLDWLEEVADALGFAHAAGVVHRDIKGDNVLLDAEGRVRVLDFGLAFVPGVDRLTRTGEIVGTPYYMAPERFVSKDVDPTQDVWSLGVLLYQALTGALPFEASNLVALVGALQEPPLRPRRRAPPVSKALEEVCLRCLAREAGERYANGARVKEAIASARAAPSARARLRWLLPAGAGCGAVLALALGLGGLPSGARTWTSQAELKPLLDSGSPAAWREALDRDAFATPQLRARLAFALASEASLPASERLAFAREAADAAPSTELSLLLARLLNAKGQGRAAAERLLEARAQGASLAALRQALALALSEGEARGDSELIRALLAKASLWAPRQWLGPSVEALLAAGRTSLAAELLTESDRLAASGEGALGNERRALLGADLARAQGQDPRPSLQRALERSPASARLALAFSLASFATGDAGTGLSVLRERPDEPLLQRLLALWSTPSHTAPLEWREALTRCLIHHARRELALARRPSALPARVRRDRVRSALRKARALEALARPTEALAAALGDPIADSLASGQELAPWAQALLAEARLGKGQAELALPFASALSAGLRGRVLSAAGRKAEALGFLEEAAEPLLAERATVAACLSASLSAAPERAARWRERLAKIDGAGRARAQVLFARYLELHHEGRPSYEQEEALLDAVLAEDPYHLDAHHYRERARFSQGDSAALERALQIASLAPRHLSALCTIVQRAEGAKAVLRPEVQTRAAGALCEPFQETLALEASGEGDPLALIARFDRILELDPGSQTARTLRGFVALRAGRLAAAQDDLERVVEDEPRSAQAQFYLALLAGARRAPAEVLERFRLAKRAGYRTRGQWTATRYPELRPYLGRPGFESLRDGLR